MRKITKQAVHAFITGNKFSSGNTTVEVYKIADQVEMRLHGNLIAVRDGAVRDTTGTYISNAGWTSNTTKERLNGLLDALNVGRIYQKDFAWYWKDGEPFPNDTFVKVI